MVGQFVASPGRAKYGIITGSRESRYVWIWWERHDVDYECLQGSFEVVHPETVPPVVYRELIAKLATKSPATA